MGRKASRLEGDPRVVCLQGVEYFVDCDKMPLGASVFLPTVATAAQVKAVLAPIESHLDIKLTVRTRVEYGRYGARVWRIA